MTRGAVLLAVAVGAVLGFSLVSIASRLADPPPRAGGPAGDDASPGWSSEGTTATAAAPCPPVASRLHDLDTLHANLTQRIDELVAADVVARFLPPRDLPHRFSGPVVRAAVEEAITRTGVSGRVEEVDCTAFPCIVLARFGSAQLAGKLQRELRLEPAYADDVTLVAPVGQDPKSGEDLVSVVAFPRNEPRGAEILAALKRRRAELLEKRATAVQ